LVSRQDQTSDAAEYGDDSLNWHPKTDHPEFFSHRIDIDPKCDDDGNYAIDPNDDTTPNCTLLNMAIRLKKGYVIASEYNKWWSAKLPIFFVDDDTNLYTVGLTENWSYVFAAEQYLTSSYRSARCLTNSTLTSLPVRCDMLKLGLSYETPSRSAFTIQATTLTAMLVPALLS
jgi:hypothetical protein